MSQIIERRGELKFAIAKSPDKAGWSGSAPGLYFWYYATRAEADKSIAYLDRKKIKHGPVEVRRNECFQLGAVAL